MTTRIKRIPKEKVAILHVCSESETLKKLVKTSTDLSIIITGNGDYTQGYVYKSDMMAKDIKDINEKLTGISGIVKELHEESVGTKGYIKTSREKSGMFLKYAMFVIALIAILFTAYNSFHGVQKIESSEANLKQVIREQQGVSKVTRGGYVKFNDRGLSDSIKIK